MKGLAWFFIFGGFVWLLPGSAVSDAAATVLSVGKVNGGRTLTFSITPTGLAAECTFSLYGSTKKSRLAINPQSGALLTSVTGQSDPLSLLATNLPDLRRVGTKRKQKIFFVLRVVCPDEEANSNVASVSIRRKKKGVRRPKRWLSQLGGKIAAGSVDLVDAFPNLQFFLPTDIQNAGDGSNRLFVVEQQGVIRAFANDAGTDVTTTFLDIIDRVESDGELGLLGLAFHPDFATNGYFYVNYNRVKGDIWESVISRFTATGPDFLVADPSTEQILLLIDQPFANHNAGALCFSNDGYLLIPMGDGGSADDPLGAGQDLQTLLGTIMRVDVDTAENGNNYGIPPSNPFVGNASGIPEEIFAYGVRNPWRCSVDRETGDIYIGDVGQGRREEVDIVTAGGNYGWDITEGSICHEPFNGCDTSGLVAPIFDYPRSLGASITGGYVYRGATLTQLSGLYVYGDFISGRIFSLVYDGKAATNVELFDTSSNISTFGVDEAGELYFADYVSGTIFALVPR